MRTLSAGWFGRSSVRHRGLTEWLLRHVEKGLNTQRAESWGSECEG